MLGHCALTVPASFSRSHPAAWQESQPCCAFELRSRLERLQLLQKWRSEDHVSTHHTIASENGDGAPQEYLAMDGEIPGLSGRSLL